MAKPKFTPRPQEEVFAKGVSGDTWKNPHYSFTRQVTGKFYFTNQRIVFVAAALVGSASVSWELEMKDIASVIPCLSPPFFPFGILITTKSGEEYLIAVLMRKGYMAWINRWITK